MPIVRIDSPMPADADEFLTAVARSKALHADWVAPPATADAFARYLERLSRSEFAAFLVRRAEDRALLGAINVSNIIGEPLCSAFVGFYAFEPFAGQGYIRAGLRLVLAHAFNVLGLHRIEANIQPANVASIALVQAIGFRREGFSPKYLHVAGEWRDHERWAILAEEFNPAAAAREP